MSSPYRSPWQPKVSVSSEEKAEMLSYVSVIYAGVGLPLSALRKPGDTVSLQTIEVIAAALIADGSLRAELKYGARGNSTYALYHLVGG